MTYYKSCSSCGQSLPLTRFGSNVSHIDGAPRARIAMSIGGWELDNVGNNLTLIAHAPTDLRALLRVVEAAEARMEMWTAETYADLRAALTALREAQS